MVTLKHKILYMQNKFYTVRGYTLKDKTKITSAIEDYLEMIYRNNKNNNYTRIKELSELLNVKDSSVSKMVQKLANLRLINYKKYGYITLTDKGKKMGSFLLKRHNIIETFLKLIGCNNTLKQTELIEHILNDETLEKINKLNEFLKRSDIINKYITYKKK